ncbi:MAG TPA: tetratricopeptide repeat protein, partial [Candidatus Acidoferrum sp.]|nr:tetratricopeptide repeat protein [Candidatus Acidoferrum sp.]
SGFRLKLIRYSGMATFARMRTGTLAFVVMAFVGSSCSFAHAKPYLDSTKIAVLESIQDNIFNDRFAVADSISRTLVVQYPADPMGYLMSCSALLAEMTDREEDLFGDKIGYLLDTAEQTAKAIADTADTSTQAWMHLLIGHTKAYRSLYESRFGSFTSAVRQGLSAKKEYGKARLLDSSLYDVDAGLGSYHYWKSVKAGFFRWIGLFRNDRNRGITELCRASESSLISRQSARSALIWVWLDAHQYDSAIAIAKEMLQKYPKGRAFLWPLAEAYFQKKDYNNAISIYTQIRELLASDPGNYYNIVECDYYLVRSLESIEDRTKAQEKAAQLHDYYVHIPPRTRERQFGHISYLKRIAAGQ